MSPGLGVRQRLGVSLRPRYRWKAGASGGFPTVPWATSDSQALTNPEGRAQVRSLLTYKAQACSYDKKSGLPQHARSLSSRFSAPSASARTVSSESHPPTSRRTSTCCSTPCAVQVWQLVQCKPASCSSFSASVAAARRSASLGSARSRRIAESAASTSRASSSIPA